MMARDPEQGWHGFWSRSRLLPWLAPFGGLFAAAARRRYRRHREGADGAWRAAVPVIVVGNLSVGGTGKTPMVLWLVNHLRQRGWRPGVVSRGYGGRRREEPMMVTSASDCRQSGDEALLMARRTAAPVVVAADRVAAVRRLLQEDVDIVISDDGLQHYRLARDVEIVMIDGCRGLGNGRCLPAGPLREPPERLRGADLTVVTGNRASACAAMAAPGMALRASGLLQPDSLTPISLQQMPEGPVHAVAGIGHPQRFFRTLEQLGCEVIEHPYPDHHVFRWQELDCMDDRPIVMTEKDMMRCLPDLHRWPAALRQRCLAVVVDAVPEPAFETALAAVMTGKGLALEHRT
ncbi:MAG: tetraacyldisaccharide 4'-kinase [Gammaproteobacteria bacterium]|nr:tetraacyldisaccharide 4'-kinase [Gammaproteobacteria bacterium]